MAQQAHPAMTPPPPLTAAERRQVLATIRRINRRRAAMFAARGSRLFPEAATEVTAMRAEREAELP